MLLATAMFTLTRRHTCARSRRVSRRTSPHVSPRPSPRLLSRRRGDRSRCLRCRSRAAVQRSRRRAAEAVLPGMISFWPGRILAFGRKTVRRRELRDRDVVLPRDRPETVARLHGVRRRRRDIGDRLRHERSRDRRARPRGREPHAACRLVAGAAAAGVSGLNVIADDDGGCCVVAGVDARTRRRDDRRRSGWRRCHPATELAWSVELQPGFAKIRISAKRWMPTTIPKIFRIFIGGFG